MYGDVEDYAWSILALAQGFIIISTHLAAFVTNKLSVVRRVYTV